MGVRVTVFPAEAIRQAYLASTPQRVQIANQMVATAQPRAAVETGSYRSSYGVEIRGSRVFAIINDPDASYIVFGTVDTPPHTELLVAASHFGRYSGWQPGG
jgi:hypothetical protein